MKDLRLVVSGGIAAILLASTLPVIAAPPAPALRFQPKEYACTNAANTSPYAYHEYAVRVFPVSHRYARFGTGGYLRGIPGDSSPPQYICEAVLLANGGGVWSPVYWLVTHPTAVAGCTPAQVAWIVPLASAKYYIPFKEMTAGTVNVTTPLQFACSDDAKKFGYQELK